jgi:DNA invertase Pin-like site-specific DNA recombinase
MIKAIENKPAAIYLRCSTEDQSESIRDQRREVLKYASENRYLIVDEFVDEGVTGTRVKGRHGFQRLMTEALSPNARFNTVIVYDLSRFSRGTPFEAIKMRQQLLENGVDVVSVTEPLSGNDMDYVMVSLRQMEAHGAVKKISENTIRGQKTRAREGAWMGGLAPYGYDLEYVNPQGTVYARIRWLESGERILLKADGAVDRPLRQRERYSRSNADRTKLALGDPKRMETVQRIFRLYVEDGLGYKAIADLLNREGVLSPRNGNYASTAGAGWSRSTIKSIIDNPHYVGDGVWNQRTGAKYHRITGGETVSRPLVDKEKNVRNDPSDHFLTEDAHPAIIDRETFERAHRLQRHRRTAAPHRTGRSKNSRYLLSGKVRCEHCGHSYIGQAVNRGTPRRDGSRVKTFYYMCGGYASKGTSMCMKAPLPKEMIEGVVLDAIGEQVRAFIEDGGHALLRRVIKKALAPDPAADESRKRLERQAGEVGRRIDELIELLSPANKEFVDRKLETLKAERDRLNDQLAELGVQQSRLGSIDALVDEAMEGIKAFKEDFADGTLEEQKELVSLMVEKVDVDPVGRIARCYIRRFPAPSCLGTGNLLQVVAGAGVEQQKVVFPPVDVVEIPLVARGTVLVPLAA